MLKFPEESQTMVLLVFLPVRMNASQESVLIYKLYLLRQMTGKHESKLLQ